MPLVGRAEEQRRLGALIVGARNGISGALVLRGDPGIGKTALLDDVTRRARGVRVIRCDGFEGESTMPYAALQRLSGPLAGHAQVLPARQQQALQVAAGAAEGPPPDRFLVGLGMLGLLADAAHIEPLVCVVDDAHWLDEESLDVLGFVARRLEAEPVALLLALRDDPRLDVRIAGIPALRLGGLDPPSAVALLSASVSGVLDPVAAARVAAATGGNPLALVDLAHDLSVVQLTDTTLGPEPIPVGHHLEAHYVRRVRLMDPGVQQWLLLAAADSTGNPDLVTRAAGAIGLPEDAARAAEKAGLVVADATVAFRHPLVRSAVYGAATGSERRAVHRALADAAGALQLAEPAAWHAAKATLGTDPAVADRLEQVADTAGARGGFLSRASVLTQAADLTPPGALRAVRLISAAEAAAAAGAAQVTHHLLDQVDEGKLDVVQRGRLIAARSSLAAFTADPDAIVHASANMLEAAACFHGTDPEREQVALLRAFELALPAEWMVRGVSLHELGTRLAEGAETASGHAATVLAALSAHILAPYPDAVPVMRRAVDVLLDLDDEELLQYGFVGVALTTALWDERARRASLLRAVAIARDAGSLQLLDTVLWVLSLAELSGGSPRRAGQYVEQVRELRRALGYPAEHVVNVAHLAWIGAPRRDIESIAQAMLIGGFGGVHTSAMAALAARDLAEGRYRDGYERLQPLIDRPFLQVTYLMLPDFVEAAVRSGHPAQASSALRQLSAMASACGTPWVQSVAARCQGLTAADADAEPLYRLAVERGQAADTPVELARAHLLYGEWLRRLKRRRDAREQLAAALSLFEAEGVRPFAERARTELAACGVRLDPAEPPLPLDLTSQEATVAQLAAHGHTNAEIGATLFISANTVDYHLRKVFAKLAISSRRQLADRLGARP